MIGSVLAENAGVDISDNHGADPGIQSEAVEEITDAVNELKLPEDKTTEQAPVEMEHHNLTMTTTTTTTKPLSPKQIGVG